MNIDLEAVDLLVADTHDKIRDYEVNHSTNGAAPLYKISAILANCSKLGDEVTVVNRQLRDIALRVEEIMIYRLPEFESQADEIFLRGNIAGDRSDLLATYRTFRSRRSRPDGFVESGSDFGLPASLGLEVPWHILPRSLQSESAVNIAFVCGIVTAVVFSRYKILAVGSVAPVSTGFVVGLVVSYMLLLLVFSVRGDRKH